MKNESRALAWAPLITPFAFALYAFFADISGFNMDEGVLTYLGLFLGMTIASLPVAYIYEFFIGYRFFRLLVKKNRVNFYTLTLGGVFVADIPLLITWPVTLVNDAISFNVPLQLFSFVGLMIGLNFWVLLNFEDLRDYLKGWRKPA